MAASVPQSISTLQRCLKRSHFECTQELQHTAKAFKMMYPNATASAFVQLCGEGCGRSRGELERCFLAAKRPRKADPSLMLGWVADEGGNAAVLELQEQLEAEAEAAEEAGLPGKMTDMQAAEHVHAYLLTTDCRVVKLHEEREYERLWWDGRRWWDNKKHQQTKLWMHDHARAISRKHGVPEAVLQNGARLARVLEALDTCCFDREDAIPALLDANQSLLGFDNGVLELHTGAFRPAQPEDYVLMSCGYAYQPQRDPAKEAEVTHYFQQMFPDPAVMHTFLTLLASCLEGGNRCKVGPFLYGPLGNGGKTAVCKFMKKAMGRYGGSLEAQQFTGGGTGTGSANSQLKAVIKCRFVYVEEAKGKGGKCEFDLHFYKAVTGNGELQVRDLHERAGTGRACDFTPFINLNGQVVVADGQEMQPVLNRAPTIPMYIVFTEEPTEVNHRLMDKNIEERFAGWRPHLMNILLHDYFTPFRAGGYRFDIPAACKSAQATVFPRDNLVERWLAERVRRCEEGFMPLAEARADFSQYWSLVEDVQEQAAKVDFDVYKKRLGDLLSGRAEWKPNGINRKATGGKTVRNCYVGVQLLPQDGERLAEAASRQAQLLAERGAATGFDLF